MGLAVLVLYAMASIGLFCYGVNCYYLVFTYVRTRKTARSDLESVDEAWWEDRPLDAIPHVTIQLPVFNERYVVERLLDAVCAIDYPREKFEVQLLDDSTDDTVEIGAAAVARHRDAGTDVHHVRRESRVGYKAGALAHGTAIAKGEYLAIFDADFVPEPDFLRKTIPWFDSEDVCLVQTRWGHLNENYSTLTRAQGIGIDGHFIVEQGARAFAPHFMNFNGTAGIWRRSAIDEAGGWQHDTLTEDLDLSYRAQLAGWRMVYLADVVTRAELPPEINAFKTQQHRWAKGSIQTAIKLMPRVWGSSRGLVDKVQASLHLTGYLVHPLMLATALLSVPLFWMNRNIGTERPFIALGAMLSLAFFGPSLLYAVSQAALYPGRWWKRLAFLPVLIIFGTGIAVNNTRAVLEAVFGVESGFLRTPKWNIQGREGSSSGKNYGLGLKPSAFVEIAIGLYCLVSLVLFVERGAYLIGPFLALYSTAFLVVGSLSIRQGVRRARAARA